MFALFLMLVLSPLEAYAKDAISTVEVSKHSTELDCWIIINSDVFDITSYIPKHPAPRSVLTKYCGKDATEGWNTKDKAKSHSKSAHRLLDKYKVGGINR